MNFGGQDVNGADGMYFVLQTAGNDATGRSGGGMGFDGFSPSLGIEFDTWNNTDIGDIPQDHIAINKNGDPRHSGPNSLISPLPAKADGGNIEDGQDHLVRIVWEQVSKTLSVYFDCELRVSTRINMQFDIFGGQNLVYWGFTAATGGSVNVHTACLRDDILIDENVRLCRGDTILLNARESQNDTYSWSPSTFLDDTTVRTPKCFATTPMQYEVRYLDLCGNLLVDTINIGIDEPFTLDEGEDTLLCDDEEYYFDLRSSYDSVQWSGMGFGNQKRVLWRTEGEYRLRAWKGVCYDDDTFEIENIQSPSILLETDMFFCENDSVEVRAAVTPGDLIFTWSDGVQGISSRYFHETTFGSVFATNECGNDTINFSVTRLDIEDFTLGDDTFLCEGDSILLDPILSQEYDYEWNTGATTATIYAQDSGLYSLEINRMGVCYKRQSINVDLVEKVSLPDLDDIELCINERRVIHLDEGNGRLLWNGQFLQDSFILENYEGLLEVEYSNSCFSDSAEIEVTQVECVCDILFPTAFTPNNDNLNPVLTSIIDCNRLKSYEQRIYNRWGEQVFYSDSAEVFWDGTHLDKPVQNGLYFHITEWIGIVNGSDKRHVEKGSVYVLR